jgi:hypothetical protein
MVDYQKWKLESWFGRQNASTCSVSISVSMEKATRNHVLSAVFTSTRKGYSVEFPNIMIVVKAEAPAN